MKTQVQKRAKLLTALFFCIGLSAIAFFIIMKSNATTTHAHMPSGTQVLSQMTDDESIEFIVDSGVEIPADFANSAELGSIIKGIIRDVEADPECEFIFSYDVTLDFAENIRSVVNEYYDLHNMQRGQASPMAIVVQALQDSTFWSNSGYMSYNCYAFSIGRDENPSEYSTRMQYQPGEISDMDFTTTQGGFMSLTIAQMANVVKADLTKLGFSDISITTTKPIVQEGEKLICIRKGSQDYHFMRYDAGSWYHKPGFTSILKYNYEPTNSRVWRAEGVALDGITMFYEQQVTYTSDIYFIKYRLPFTFSVSSGQVTVTGVKQGVTLAGRVEIPSEYNGLPVTRIADSAFSGMERLTSITIPDSVTAIGNYSFEHCSGLRSINIPGSVTAIGQYAFAECTGLTSITIPAGVTNISSGAFVFCAGLTSVTIPDSVTAIGQYAFAHCTGLTSVIIPSSVASLGKEAFAYTSGLSRIYVLGHTSEPWGWSILWNENCSAAVGWDGWQNVTSGSVTPGRLTIITVNVNFVDSVIGYDAFIRRNLDITKYIDIYGNIHSIAPTNTAYYSFVIFGGVVVPVPHKHSGSRMVDCDISSIRQLNPTWYDVPDGPLTAGRLPIKVTARVSFDHNYYVLTNVYVVEVEITQMDQYQYVNADGDVVSMPPTNSSYFIFKITGNSVQITSSNYHSGLFTPSEATIIKIQQWM